MKVFVFDALKPGKRGRDAVWQRSVLQDDDGTIFVPAVICGSEMAAFLAAGWDGTRAMTYRDHLFLPVEWVAKEYPRYRKSLERLRERLQGAEEVT